MAQTSPASSPTTDPGFCARHAATLLQGRILVTNPETRIAFVEPFLLAARSESSVFETIVRRVSSFGFVLVCIIGTLVLLRAAPPHFLGIVALWLFGGVAARVIARRRRSEHGDFLFDFDAGTVQAQRLAGPFLSVSLASCSVQTARSGDPDAAVWILVRTDHTTLRMGRGSESDVDRVLAILRRHHIPVERLHE